MVAITNLGHRLLRATPARQHADEEIHFHPIVSLSLSLSRLIYLSTTDASQEVVDFGSSSCPSVLVRVVYFLIFLRAPRVCCIRAPYWTLAVVAGCINLDFRAPNFLLFVLIWFLYVIISNRFNGSYPLDVTAAPCDEYMTGELASYD